VQGAVGVAVAAVVEAVAGGLAAAGGNRAGATQSGERGVAAEALDVLAGGDEQLAGVAGGDAQQLSRARRGRLDERLELDVEVGDLGVERVDPAGERAQRELRGLGGPMQLARAGPQAATERGLAADRLALGELFAQLLRGGHDQL